MQTECGHDAKPDNYFRVEYAGMHRSQTQTKRLILASTFAWKMDVKQVLGGGSDNGGTSMLHPFCLGKWRQNGCWVGVRKWTSILHPFWDSPQDGCPILCPFRSLTIKGEREEEGHSGHGSQARLPSHRRYPRPAIMSVA